MVTIFVIGVLCAVLVEEATGHVPGGYVVPGFMALACSTDPWHLPVTLAVVLLVMGIVRACEAPLGLYGRQRLGFAVMTGVVLKLGAAWLFPKLGLLPAAALVVGYVVPGVVAERCRRQGGVATWLAIGLATALTWLIGRAVAG